MGRLPLVSLALVALTAAGGGFLLPPQEDEGEWDDEGKGDWIADLLSAADSAAQVGDSDCEEVLLDAAAGYGFANRVINDPDLYFETDAYGHTEHRGQTTTIWIDHEHSPNVTRTRLWEGLRASLRGENTRGVFENWRKRYWVKWWSNRCWKYIATGGFH